MLRKCAALLSIVLLLFSLTACKQEQAALKNKVADNNSLTFTVTDQLGRQVAIPHTIERVSIQETHLGFHVAYALGQQDKLVGEVSLGKLGKALDSTQRKKVMGTDMERSHTANLEELIKLKPQVIFCEVSLDGSSIRQIEDAGLTVVAIKGETIEESYEAVRLMAKVLDCEARGEEYINDCEKLLHLVEDRVDGIPVEKRLKVMVSGDRSTFSVASGQMLQTYIVRKAGAYNVAEGLPGRWPLVSTEQVIQWNPDVILLGSSWAVYGVQDVLNNPQLSTLRAVKDKRIYAIPSNIGWWDFPAPHCVLGIVWVAKTLYPDEFVDVNMTKVADEYYQKYFGSSFTALGGKL